MLLRLISEPEETEEDKRAKDGSPSSSLERIEDNGVLLQHDHGELEDTGVSPVGISPRDPWVNLTPHEVRGDTPNGQRESEAEIDGGHRDETPVATISQVSVGGDEIPELLPPRHEGTNGED